MVQTLQHRIDKLKGLIDLLTDLGTGENNLARDEDQQHDLGFHHAVDETREQLRLVRAEVVMLGSKTFKSDGKLDVARANDVLDLEIGKLGIETKLLNDTSVLAASKLAIVFTLGTGHDHLARGKDEGGGLGLANTHDDGRETLSEGEKTHVSTAVREV